VSGSTLSVDFNAEEATMTATRFELAIAQMELDDGTDDFGCDDIRTAWLCAELNRSPTGVKGNFEALWQDR
jgi:hypothetical protein